jgi:uncharacterized protein (TIGR00730 family)
MTIAIFCGSSLGNSDYYENKVIQLIQSFSQENISIVSGGSNKGLMGVILDEARKLDIKITAVNTNDILTTETSNTKLQSTYDTNTLSERKAKMEELADAFIALPGGFGTLDEISELITLMQIGKHSKPCAFYNINGFYDKLFDFLKISSQEGFIDKNFLDMIIIANKEDELIEKLKNHKSTY